MKYSFLLMSVIFSQLSHAGEVRNARLNASRDALVIDVRYQGGCKKHDFQLKLDSCSYGLQNRCEATLIDATFDDFCEKIKFETIAFPLRSSGLLQPQYRRAELTIKGKSFTRASVVLP